MKIKKGDIVTRISYGRDIIFIVDRIIEIPRSEKLAILKGVNIRIEADSYISDLELVDKNTLDNVIKNYTENLDKRISRLKDIYNLKRQRIYTGKILHLDGDTYLSNLIKCRKIGTYKQVIFNHITKFIV